MFIWQAENGVGWYFVYIDKETSSAIKDLLKARQATRVAFGSVRVEVRVGNSQWRTSLFPSKKDGVYMLPVKVEVRKNEDLQNGDELSIELSLV